MGLARGVTARVLSIGHTNIVLAPAHMPFYISRCPSLAVSIVQDMEVVYQNPTRFKEQTKQQSTVAPGIEQVGTANLRR